MFFFSLYSTSVKALLSKNDNNKNNKNSNDNDTDYNDEMVFE